MTNFKTGDKVRVTYEAIYEHGPEFDDFHRVHASGCGIEAPADATVELIEAADEPSKDPIGTVRENTGGYGGTYALLPSITDEDPWIHTTEGFRPRDAKSTLGPIIGAVPGTPAAEAQQKREPQAACPIRGCVKVEHRHLWAGDGSEEPPPYVYRVRDNDGDEIIRTGDTWHYTGYYTFQEYWGSGASCGPYTEVLPE